MKQGLGQALHDCDCEASSRHQIRRVNDASQTTVVGKSEEIFEVTSDRRQPPSSNTMVANCPATIASHLLRGAVTILGNNCNRCTTDFVFLPRDAATYPVLPQTPFSTLFPSPLYPLLHLLVLVTSPSPLPAHLTPLCLSLPLHPPPPPPPSHPFPAEICKIPGF